MVRCVLVVCLSIAAGAGSVVSVPAAQAARADALLVLPGFGYGDAGKKTFRMLTPVMAKEGVDLYVADYLSRGGLADSRSKVQRIIREQGLDKYARLHVFAFIAGAWTLNPLVQTQKPANLTTVVYDRSPYQERAPRIADEELHFLTWVRYGSPVFDLARTPYVPLTANGVNVGIVVETRPTSFIKDHEKTARSYGPFHFECDGLMQRYDDCVYIAMDHDELYERFAEVWPDVLTFIRKGRFTGGANRTPPTGDPLADAAR